MAEEQAMEKGEEQEDAELKQILQLCQSGDPAALQQIGQIVQKMLSDQQGEEKEIDGGDSKSSHDAMVEAVKSQMGG